MNVVAILWRQRIPVAIIIAVGILAAILVTVFLPPKYQATSAVLIESQQVGDRDPAFAPTDMATLVESSTVIDRTLKEFDIHRSPDDFESDITAKIGFDSNVMPIVYQDVNAKRAVAVANGLADNLSEYYREITRAKYDSLTAYLNSSIAKRRGQLDRLDRELENAAAKDPTLAEADALAALTTRLDALTEKHDEENANLTGSQAEAGATSSQLEQMMPLVHQEIAQTDPLYRSLQDQLGKDGTSFETQRAQYTKNFPGLAGLKIRVGRESDSIDRRVAQLSAKPPGGSPAYLTALTAKNHATAVATGDAARVAALQAEIEAVRAQIASEPTKGVHITEVRREHDIALAAYQALAQRRENVLAEQAQAASLGTIDVVDRAERSYPVVGKHGALLAAGAVLGFLILAVTVAFLLESLDRRLRTVESIADLYGKPVIATLRTRNQG
jgi:capsular polysaccharide biosynthesis protein